MMDISKISEYLRNYSGEEKIIMEVCGTHTGAISKNGIHTIISDKIKLVSGPGCPVCVTVASYIDKLIDLALQDNTTVVTFGDMLRVKGTKMSLSDAASIGASLKMIYSPFDVIELSKTDSGRKFVFAAVGFETTTPIYALILDELIKQKIKNVKLLTAIKTMPEAIRTVYRENSKITGFLAPGHVASVCGHNVFKNLSKELNVPFVTAGFEGYELLSAIYALTKLKGGESLNMYPMAVDDEGNEKAKEKINKYFKTYDASWRGMGIIKNSGLILKDEYLTFDAGSSGLTDDVKFNNACRCADVISGRIAPGECQMFKKICTPDTPQGACMVSTEGACFNYYINERS